MAAGRAGGPCPRARPSGALEFDGPNDADGAPCRLTLAAAPDGVHIHEGENGACRNQTSGARGGYGCAATQPASFPRGSRRPIRYLPRLLASAGYRDAIAACAARTGP